MTPQKRKSLTPVSASCEKNGFKKSTRLFLKLYPYFLLANPPVGQLACRWATFLILKTHSVFNIIYSIIYCPISASHKEMRATNATYETNHL